jgi:uncharacterized protein involved in oxidation of intracellular sulfur
MTANISPKKQIFTHSARIAKAMASRNRLELLEALAQGNEVRVFLVGGAVACAKIGQKVPQGSFHVESFLKIIAHGHGEIGVCGTCLDARGIVDTDLVKGSHRGSMPELAAWTTWADQVNVF